MSRWTDMRHITIQLTEEEAEVLDDYIFRKACRLKEAGLEDSKCYPNLMSVHRKITNAADPEKELYKPDES